MIDAVESVAANAALEPLIGAGIDGRRQQHLAMKPGIENGHLRNIAPKLLDNLHALQFRANVEWRKLGHAINGGVHLGRDYDGVFEMRAPMNYAVSHHVDFRSGSDGTRPPAHAACSANAESPARAMRRAIALFDDSREFFTVIAAVSPLHSILPSHSGSGG